MISTVAVGPKADRAKILKDLRFDKDDLLVHWNLSTCKISTMPGSFSALVCTGNLYLNGNQLESLSPNQLC